MKKALISTGIFCAIAVAVVIIILVSPPKGSKEARQYMLNIIDEALLTATEDDPDYVKYFEGTTAPCAFYFNNSISLNKLRVILANAEFIDHSNETWPVSISPLLYVGDKIIGDMSCFSCSYGKRSWYIEDDAAYAFVLSDYTFEVIDSSTDFNKQFNEWTIFTNHDDYFTENEQNEALNIVNSFFENSQERVFNILEPVKINDDYCLVIEVLGKYNGGTYLINTFAINIKTKMLYYVNISGDYERFQNIPWYAISESPNKKFSIISVSIVEGGHGGNGDYYLGNTQILDMNTSEVLWEDTAAQREKYMWSEDSRYVARQYSGRIWTNVVIIDTADFSVITLPASEEIIYQTGFGSSPAVYLSEFKIDRWVSEGTIKITFGWDNDAGKWTQGSYLFDVKDGSLEVEEINEESRG